MVLLHNINGAPPFPAFEPEPKNDTCPPNSELPDPTLNVPVDCISRPNPFRSCKSPAPSFHVDPLAFPPVIFKLPVSVRPNFAHAAPVQ